MTEAPSPEPWVHPAITVAASGIEGRGLFATRRLGAGAVVMRLGGRLVATEELAALIAAVQADPDLPYVDSVTVSDSTHLVMPPWRAGADRPCVGDW